MVAVDTQCESRAQEGGLLGGTGELAHLCWERPKATTGEIRAVKETGLCVRKIVPEVIRKGGDVSKEKTCGQKGPGVSPGLRAPVVWPGTSDYTQVSAPGVLTREQPLTRCGACPERLRQRELVRA